MNKRLIALCALFVIHGAVSVQTLIVDGYVAIFTTTCSWMLYDARTSGIPAWPFLLATPALGSFAPLAYLIARELRPRPTP